MTLQATRQPIAAGGQEALPAAVAARLNGELSGQTVVAWAPFDLDEANCYTQRFAIVTEQQLVVVGIEPKPLVLEISSIEEAKIVEGQGVDKLEIVADGKMVEMRYSRRHRREMT